MTRPRFPEGRAKSNVLPLAVVHLPRSLVALFPGATSRVEAHGSTVAEVIDDLDRRIPGLRNRLVESGPSLREHLNVFVDGEQAGLGSPIRGGAVVRVVPAVSGG